MFFGTCSNMATITTTVISTKWNLFKLIFLYICIVTLCGPSYSLNYMKRKCHLITPCQCVFPNGHGIDLIKMKWISSVKGNQTFYFHPCSTHSLEVNETANNCSFGVSLCVFHTSNHSYTNLAFTNETSVLSRGTANAIRFQYIHEGITSTIRLNCGSGKPSFSVLPSQESNHYEFDLITPAACVQYVVLDDPGTSTTAHLSTGSILVIMFLVIFSVYFIGGAVALKCLRGAEGKEMIPNYEFWASLPGLVKEGVLFTFSGCSSSQAYDRI